GPVLGALPPDPRGLALWRPTPGGEKRAGTGVRRRRPLAYRRPSGARGALLRSPILPAARRRGAARAHDRPPRVTPGAGPSNERSDTPRTADISTGPKMRTFLLVPDRVRRRGLCRHATSVILKESARVSVRTARPRPRSRPVVGR